MSQADTICPGFAVVDSLLVSVELRRRPKGEDVSVDADWLGPVDYLVVELPDGGRAAAGFAALMGLIEAGQVQILDLEILRVEATGVSVVPLDDELAAAASGFEGAYSGLLDDEDRVLVTAGATAGSVVAVIVYEILIVNPVMHAFAADGASILASGPIPAEDLDTTLDALDKES